MSTLEQRTALLARDLDLGDHASQDAQDVSGIIDHKTAAFRPPSPTTEAKSGADTVPTEPDRPLSNSFNQHGVKEQIVKSTVSIHTTDSENSGLKKDENAIGRPCRRRKFKILDSIAVLLSMICLIIAIVIVIPACTLAWRMGYQSQLIAVGFLLGVMNICADRVVPSCFIILEARYGRSRLQNYDAILAKKFLSSHINFYWRVAMVCFLALPLALSVGYKQFLGGMSYADLKPLLGMYGVSFPIIGAWAPIQDPIYLQVSSNAAFHTASTNDTPILNGSSKYPIAYGYNVLLLSEDSAALLDLPTNDYLNTIRSGLKDGEYWRLSASVNAYVVIRDTATAGKVRSDDNYWASALNASQHGLTNYYLNQDANTYIGMLPIVTQPYCWIGIFQGGPTSDSVYTKSLNDANVFNFRKQAELFSLRRQRCQGAWDISATGLNLVSGACETQSQAVISQEPVLGSADGPFTVEGSPNLPHVFWKFVKLRPNSPWLMPTYAVTVATSYWSRGVYMIAENQFPGFNYTGIDERVTSNRRTLEAAPALFLCLAIQPFLIIVAFIIKWKISLPVSGDFGLIAVLAGVKKPTLAALGGAGFSGELKRPMRLNITVSGRPSGETQCISTASVVYELKNEGTVKTRVPKIDGETIYL